MWADSNRPKHCQATESSRSSATSTFRLHLQLYCHRNLTGMQTFQLHRLGGIKIQLQDFDEEIDSKQKKNINFVFYLYLSFSFHFLHKNEVK